MGDEIAKPENAQRLDVNGDGRFTIGDLPGLLLEGFFLPGDWLVWAAMTHVPSFARFVELDTGDYGSVLSGSVSGLVWLAFVLLLVMTYRSVRNFDEALTARLGQGYAEARRRLRIGAALVGQRWRRARDNAPAPAHETVEFAAEAELGADELRALRLHANLEPGYALGLDDVAVELERGRGETREILSRLVELGFVHATLGGDEGEGAFTLTRAGRAYLTFLELGARGR